MVAVELIDKTQQTQQERQEEVAVACRVVCHLAGKIALRTAENLVKANAVNLNAELGKVLFAENMEAVEEVLA